MFFLGPIFGGLIGFILGGIVGVPFLGMVIGAFLGSSSRGAYNVHRRGSFFGNDFGGQDRAGEVFFESIFSMLGKIASADGSISPGEKRVIQNFMTRQLGMNLQSQQVALEYFNSASRDQTRTFDYWARNLYSNYSNRRAILELAYNLLQQVASADGTISSGEKAMLETAAQIFGLSGRSSGNSQQSGSSHYSHQSGYGGQSSQGNGNLTKAYASMGITSAASEDEIKKSYRKKVAEFHPDKIAAKGLPSEFTQFATEKFQEIQDSYEVIKKARGF